MCFNILFKVAIILMGILPQIVAFNTCRSGKYTVKDKYGVFIKCTYCVICPPKLGATVPCDTVVYPDTKIACNHCDPGKTFSSEYDEKPCQPCKSSTCHRNEEWVGKCTKGEDNTRCNSTCIEGYYWSSENNTEPCQLLYHGDSNGDRNATLATTLTPPTMTDKEESPGGNVIAIVVPIAVVIIVIAVFCVCPGFRSCPKYVCYRSRCNDVEHGESNNESNNASNNAGDYNRKAEVVTSRTNDNARSVQENEPLIKSSDSAQDVQDGSSTSETELNPDEQTPLSLSVPGGTSVPEQKECSSCSSREPSKECKVATFKIGNLVPDTHRKFCDLLDIRRTLGGDYNTLASKLGYDTSDVARFEKNKNPTKEMLDDWGTKPQNTVLPLMMIVKEMNRYDAFMLLDNAIQSVQCICGKCPEIPSMNSAENSDNKREALTRSCETSV